MRYRYIDCCRIGEYAGERYGLSRRVVSRCDLRRVCARYGARVAVGVVGWRERDSRGGRRPLLNSNRRRCCCDGGYRFRGYGFFPNLTRIPAVFLTSDAYCGQLAAFFSSALLGDAPLLATAVPPSPVFFGFALVVLFHA